MISAIVDVPKENGKPRLRLPEGFDLQRIEDAACQAGGVRREFPRWRITRTEDAGDGPQAHLSVLLSNSTRWVAWFTGPKKGLEWLENKLGADIYRVTPELVRDQRTALENLGLLFDGAGRLLAPHVVCGQSPWMAPAE